MQALHEIFEQQAEQTPDGAAVRCGDARLTYAALNRRANAIAAALCAAGVEPGDRVGLCLTRGTDLIAGLLGILKCGAAYVPLDPAYPRDRLARMLDKAAPALLLVDPGSSSALPDHGCPGVDVTAITDESGANPGIAVTADDLCYIIFTSGSTGRPKGVMVTHGNVSRLFPQVHEQLSLGATDCWTLFHSVAFGFSVWEIFGALLSGAELVIVPEAVRADPRALHTLLRDSGVTTLSLTPSAFRQVVLHPDFDAGNLALRCIVLSGEALHPDDLRHWREHGFATTQLINSFAITETGGQVTLHTCTPDDLRGAGHIGVPLHDTPVWVVDAELRPLPPGEEGELCVGGPGVARGYVAEPELTAAAFIELHIAGERHRLYRTGDRARLLDDGSIEFAGRADNQLKIRGHRIEPGEIEALLTGHPDVRECAVVASTNAGSTRLIAYVVATANAESDWRQLTADTLPEYMRPSAYVVLDRLPLGPAGKLDRNALPEPGRERPQLATPYAAPSTELQSLVAAVWERELGVAPIGVHDDFFELGGDSILALKVTTALREKLGEYIYLESLLQSRTPAALAEALQEETSAATTTANDGEELRTAMTLPDVIPNFADRFEPFPLTDIQQAYLVGRGTDFAMGNVSTHLYIEVDATDLDLPRLERAWQKVIARHAMLRAVVLQDGTQQVLANVPDYRFPQQDLRTDDAASVQTALEAERERLSHQVIPSDRWPLFELSASLLPNDIIRLHISLDCLITDARSFQIISAELLRFYEDPEATLPLAELSFRDYVLAEHRLRDTALYAQALRYWRDRIETLPAMPQLPLARAPETLQRQHFVQRGDRLPAADWSHFRTRAARAGITPTVALLQCFGEALAAWSRVPRLTLNLTLFNRLPLHPEVDDVVGDFTSLVLLGIDSLADGSFEDRARRLQAELWRGVDNRFVSGVQVMREIARRGDRIQPMMPIVFTSILGVGRGGEDDSSWHRLGKQVYSVSQTPQVWIDHVAMEREGALVYTWDVVEELFPDGMIDALFGAYAQRLHELATDDAAWEHSWNATLAKLLPMAQAASRAAANDTAAPVPPGLLHDGFIRQAALQPAAPAVITGERTLTYGELDTLSNRLAAQLVDADVQPNQLVAVVMQKGWEQVVAVLGILKAGAAYMPVDAAMPAERLHYLLEFGEVRVAVTQTCQEAAIDWPANITRLQISAAALTESDMPVTTVTSPATPADIAYVIFTSGSTGQPKGVVIDHRGALNTCTDINQRFGIGVNDRVLALSSLSFDLSVYDIFGLLAAGGAIVIPDAGGMRDPSHWATLVARHRVTVWNTVPALMDLVTDYAEQQAEPVLQSLRVVMLSGDWIPVKLPDRIRALGTIDVYSLGGATEASIWSILYPVGNVPADWTSIPYGKPLVNQTFHVLSPDLTPCPDWVPGELYIGGIGVAMGYWRDPEKTSASFIVHPGSGERLYRTGDLGRYLPDGNIEFMGREDFQVKVQGFRVELGDIEAALEAHPQVRNAVVTAAGPDRGNKRLVGYVVAEQQPHPSTAELRDWLGGKLPEYMVPAAFVMLERLPLTANGKVDRRELPDPPAPETQRDRPSPAGPLTAPHGQLAQIGAIVGDVLQSDGIDPAANLLQLGATSIEMIRIANALDQRLGYRPRMDEFYREPTVNGLAALVGAQTPAVAVTEEPAGRDPLLTPAWLLNGVPKIMDPDARNAFKASRPALRHPDGPAVTLPGAALPADRYSRHRSYRDFDAAPVSLASLAAALNPLRSVQLESHPKYLYASAGGMYPVQTYLYFKPDRVTAMEGGYYYYNPDDHRLSCLGGEDRELRNRYDPIVNRPIFDRAAFAVFLVADLATLGAMYRDRALHYATLEAGHMTQLLETHAPDAGLGLCQTGGLETEVLRPHLDLGDNHLVLHGLLGGKLPDTGSAAAERPAAAVADERDEGEL